MRCIAPTGDTPPSTPRKSRTTDGGHAPRQPPESQERQTGHAPRQRPKSQKPTAAGHLSASKVETAAGKLCRNNDVNFPARKAAQQTAPLCGAPSRLTRQARLPSVHPHCRGRRTKVCAGTALLRPLFACHGTPPAAGRAWVPGCRVRTCGPCFLSTWPGWLWKPPDRDRFVI